MNVYIVLEDDESWTRVIAAYLDEAEANNTVSWLEEMAKQGETYRVVETELNPQM